MKKKVSQNYQELAQSTGLRFDADGGALYGERGEYSLTITAPNTNYPYMLTVSVSAQRPGEALTNEERKQFKEDNKPVTGLAQKGNVLTMSLKNTTNQENLQESLNEALNALTSFLRARGFQNCCQTCGKAGQADPCYISGSYMQLCPDCYTTLQRDGTMKVTQKTQKKENVVGGVVGALIGSVLGVICIIVFSQLGYVAALSGVVMAVCTLKGYELLGGKLTRKGIVISIVIMLVMTFFGDQLDWAILISRELQVDFTAAFRGFSILLAEQIIEPSSYWTNLGMLYVFLLLGAVPTIFNTLKNQKREGRIYQLGRGVPQL